ncbi:MAG: hypothetical protein ACFCVK_22505 [Acidimicrobiales bacterium]
MKTNPGDTASGDICAMLVAVRAPTWKRTIPSVAVTLGLLLAGCGDGDDDVAAGSAGGAESASTESTTSTTVETTTSTTAAETTTSVAADLSRAEEFQDLVPLAMADLPDDVSTFFADATPQRIDELATLACDTIMPDMTTIELGLAANGARAELTDAEAELLDLTEFGTAFGALAGFYCPENLPADIVGSLPTGDDADVASFRTSISSFLGQEHPGVALVDGMTDARIDEVQAAACAATNPDQDTTQLGLAVFEIYNDELTDDERALISVDSFAGLYGVMIAFFCSDQLPTG